MYCYHFLTWLFCTSEDRIPPSKSTMVIQRKQWEYLGENGRFESLAWIITLIANGLKSQIKTYTGWMDYKGRTIYFLPTRNTSRQ